ncbi:polycystin-2-like [Convolutriloba macropyga]|uniref:polycystin-2-like n=1 Tax=Convolutriloba macropyga TaxID=536237 RepID=UPI003F51F77F
MLSVLCQRRAKKQLVQQEVDYLNYLDGRVGGLTEEEAKIIAEDEPVTFENEKHLYSGEEIGDIIVGKMPDEEFLDEGSEFAKRAKVNKFKKFYIPLLPGQLSIRKKGFLRIVRQKEIEMFGVIQEITLYLVFIWLLFSVCYTEKDATGFYLYDEVKQVLFTDSLDQANDTGAYWKYLIDEFVPNLYSLEWYNGQRPLGLFQYFGDKVNLVIGYAVIRQLRVRKNLCMPYKVGRHNISRHCIPPFSAEFEDRGRYGPNWTKFDANNPYHILREEYRYIDAEEIDGEPFWGQSAYYPGGGFLVRLDGNIEDSLHKLKALRNEIFIDHYTRAMMHEFAIYNPTYNLFAVVTMVSEFLASSGVHSYYYCDPLRLIQYHGPTAPYQIVVQIGLGIFLLGFIIRDGAKIHNQGKFFFHKSWNVIDFVIDLLGLGAIVLFMIRYTETENAMARVSLVGGRQFVNLNHLVSVSNMYLVILASVCFVSTIRFLKILNFNKKISMFRDVLVACREDLVSFTIMFVVLQAGFVTMAHLFFGNFLVRYATMFQTQQSLFNMLLGKFSFQQLIDVDETLGAIFFMSYSNCMMLITLNIFVVILDVSVGHVNKGLAEKSNEYEILSFLGGRARYWIRQQMGSAKQTVADLKHRKEIEERRALDNKIADLPHKFNHLLDLINDRYFDGQEVFHIHVNDYKDIRLLEKARKRAPKDIRSLNNTNNNKDINGNGVPQGGIPADHHAQEGEESSSDEEMYENMTSDFNTLIPRPKANSVQSKKPVQ